MSDYETWCRICGSLSSLSEIDREIIPILVGTFELDPKNFRICLECHQSLIQFNLIVTRSHELAKMFKGLDEEDKNDLDTIRLNAYRKHFELTTFITEETKNLHKIEEPNLVEEEFIHDPQEIEVEEIFEDEMEEERIEEFPEESDKKLEEDESLFDFKCHICVDLQYSRLQSLTDHCKRIHNCLPKVKCCSEECGKFLSTWRRLKIHKERHFPSEDVMQCDQCHRVFSTVIGFEKHKQSHSRLFFCSYCAKSFKDPKILRFHEKIHEKEVDERRNFECSHCGRKFVTKQACQNHIGQRHEQIVSFFCMVEDCKKGFYTQKALCEHRRVHGERTFRCEQCSFMAKTKSALRAHMDNHVTEMKFKCEICENSFPSNKRLKTHMICHIEDTPYVCDQCNAKFKRRKDLNSHMNTHSGRRAFICTFCPRTFTNASNCRKHKVKDHPEELKAYEFVHGSGRKLDCYSNN